MADKPRLPPIDAVAKFEAAIGREPDNRENYLVYGDWLMERGDPRGELIAIGAELQRNPMSAKLLAAHRDHVAAHGGLLGPLVDCSDLVTGIEWAFGFIKRCRVANTIARYSAGPTVEIHDVLHWLLDDPGPGRFVQELALGMIAPDANHYQAVIDALAARRRAALRTLSIGDFDREDGDLESSHLGDLSALWRKMPFLEFLTLRGGSMKIGPLTLARLQRLKTITNGLDAESLEHITDADFPALHTLDLQIGLGARGAATDVELVEPILNGHNLPRLIALRLTNCDFTDAICERLVKSALIPRIHELDLGMGTMTDDGAAILLAHAGKLNHLRIDVSNNYLSDDMCRQLSNTFRDIDAGEQREGDPRDRGAAAYE